MAAPADQAPMVDPDATTEDDDEVTLPARVVDIAEADTLRWVPIAQKFEPAPETKPYGSGE